MSSLIKTKGKKKTKKTKHCLTRYFHLQFAILIYHSTLPAPLFISLVNWSWVWATCQTSSMYRGFFHVRWLKWVYRNHWSIISSHGNIKLQVIHWGFCFFKIACCKCIIKSPSQMEIFLPGTLRMYVYIQGKIWQQWDFPTSQGMRLFLVSHFYRHYLDFWVHTIFFILQFL